MAEGRGGLRKTVKKKKRIELNDPVMVSHSSTWFPILKPACKQMSTEPFLPLLEKTDSLGLRTTGARVSQEFHTHG